MSRSFIIHQKNAGKIIEQKKARNFHQTTFVENDQILIPQMAKDYETT
jgi:hypothetical protein